MKSKLFFALLISSFLVGGVSLAVTYQRGCETDLMRNGLQCNWSDGGRAWCGSSPNPYPNSCNVLNMAACPSNPANGSYAFECAANDCVLNCNTGFTKCSNTCVANCSLPNCSSCNPCNNTCTLCNSGYSWNGSACTMSVLRLGPDSVSGSSVIQSVANTAIYVPGSNVGIGTSSPVEKLSISSGAIYLDNYTPVATTNRLYSIGGNLYWNGSPVGSGSGGGLWALSGSNLYASSTAWSVGIGTISPGMGNLLNVKGATPAGVYGFGDGVRYTGQLLIESSDAYTAQKGGRIAFSGIAGTGGGAFVGMTRQDSVYGTIEGYKTNNLANNAGGGLIFSTNYNPDGKLYERMRIDGDGNVGIGTINPSSAKLVVAPSASTPAIDTGNYTIRMNYAALQDNDVINKAYLTATIQAATSSMASFWSAVGNNIRNTNSGNVGIGTSNPTAKLDVIGPIKSNSRVVVEGGTNIMLAVDEFGIGTAGLYSGSGKIMSFDDNNQIFKYANDLIVSDGNSVGIGTDNPGQMLGVAGTIRSASLVGSGSRCLYTNASGDILAKTADCGSGSGEGDNLGNHTAKQNIVLGKFWLSYDGKDGGLAISDKGGVGIGTNEVGNYALNVNGDAYIKGTLTLNTLNLNKLTVNTIDPLYRIGGVNYSTFASSIVGGTKEEYVGRLKVANEAVIDFDKIEKGSDLWVWRQTVDFSPETVEVFLSPYGSFANTYYLISGNQIIFRSDRPTELSYRLIGKRFDWRNWPTLSHDQSTIGLEIK